MQSVALDINKLMVNHRISFEIQWVPRDRYVCADYVIKLVDFDDRGVFEIFLIIKVKLGSI